MEREGRAVMLVGSGRGGLVNRLRQGRWLPGPLNAEAIMLHMR